MRCVFAGTPDVAAVALRGLLASRHDVVGVITRPDAPVGRGRSLKASSVADLADEAGIPLLKPSSSKDPELRSRLEALAPDCCPVVAYGGLIPPALLAVPTHGWVNLHFSLLPAWRGAAPVQHAIWNGDSVTGATTFLLDEGLDTGDILMELREPIAPSDTSGSLLERLAHAGSDLLVRTLDALDAGTVVARAQVGEPSLAPKITVDDAHIDWSRPAAHIDRWIRAMSPAPGAWTQLGDDRLRLLPVAMTDESSLAPGQVRIGPRSVEVGTGTTEVRLGDVRAPGKRQMPAADWARGLRDVAGIRLR